MRIDVDGCIDLSKCDEISSSKSQLNNDLRGYHAITLKYRRVRYDIGGVKFNRLIFYDTFDVYIHRKFIKYFFFFQNCTEKIIGPAVLFRFEQNFVSINLLFSDNETGGGELPNTNNGQLVLYSIKRLSSICHEGRQIFEY